jgi:hypothetical protein
MTVLYQTALRHGRSDALSSHSQGTTATDRPPSATSTRRWAYQQVNAIMTRFVFAVREVCTGQHGYGAVDDDDGSSVATTPLGT